MKKYVLNEIPIKTTNSFKVNNIEIDLDIPDIDNFDDIILKNTNSLEVIINKNCGPIKTGLGISFNKSYKIKLIVPENIEVKDTIKISYNFDNNRILVSDIEIIYEKNSSANFILNFTSSNNYKYINSINQKVVANNNSKGNITILNLLNNNSYNFLSITSSILEGASIVQNFIDIGGNIKLANINTDLEDENAKYYLNNLYLGNNSDIIDINYYIKNKYKNTTSNILVEGVLLGNAKKTYKGTIDFYKGASNSIGIEKENCVLLSKKAISRSVPILLCSEDNVIGKHGVSTGNLDDRKIFYLMSRGLSENDAKKLLINSNLNKIIDKINDSYTESIIYNYIDNKL